MRNRRSVLEQNKEKYLKEEVFSKGVFVLPRKQFVEKQVASNTNLLNNDDDFHEYGSESSASKEQEIRYNLISDLETALNRINFTIDLVKNNHRSYINSFENARQRFKKLERDANRELLLSLKKDAFSYGVTDNFQNNNFVDLERSTTNIVGNKITLGASSFSTEDLEISSIETRITSPNSIVQSINRLSNPSNVQQKDGSSFKTIAIASTQDAVVELEVLIYLSSATNIEKLEVVSRALESNSKEGISIYYSKDRTTFIQPEFHDTDRLETGSNIFDVYDSSIKALKIIFTKYSYDRRINNNYEYFFSVDFIGKIKYSFNSESVFYSKGYEIEDEDGNPVDFSLATIKTGTCCIIPNNTSISFYLSKDGENYREVGFYDETNDVIEFKNSIDRDIFQRSNPETESDLISENGSTFLNNYIPSNISYIQNTIEIKRNLNKWQPSLNGYKTTIEINSIEGRYFDLQDTSCRVNGVEKTGLFFLPRGRYEIETSRYQEVLASGINSESELRQQDSYYPTNHKYIFEGFSYKNSFTGNKVYVGADNLYEKYLTKVSKSFFDINPNRRDIFCLIERDEGTFIQVHQAGYSAEEEFYLTCRINENNIDNKVYVKAVLKSRNPRVSPRIDSIQIRVV